MTSWRSFAIMAGGRTPIVSAPGHPHCILREEELVDVLQPRSSAAPTRGGGLSPRDEVQCRGRTTGFTLVELLMVTSIIAVLVALLLPAVQAAREAARVAQCRNHLKQLVLGCLAHENATGRFPTGGWGDTGDPDLGTDRHQTGPWLYNILPYIEQRALHDMGAGLGFVGRARAGGACPLRRRSRQTRNGLACRWRRSIARRAAPPRRTPAACAGTTCWQYAIPPFVGKTDYAANSGIGLDIGGLPWHGSLGPIFLYGEIRVRDIRDGTSNTYLAGEKFVRADGYTIGILGGGGEDSDAAALTGWWCAARQTGTLGPSGYPSFPPYLSFPPTRDVSGDPTLIYLSYYRDCGFGSAHPDGLGMGFCDGSVRSISYSIAPMVHAELGTIADGLPADAKGY